MRRGIHILAALWASGCEQAPGEGFHVTVAFPSDGDEAFPETPVRVGFSDAVDEEACEPAIQLAAVVDDEVVELVAFTLRDGDDPDTYELEHDPLVAGLEHVLTVETGAHGCVSASGERLAPFASRFEVVER